MKKSYALLKLLCATALTLIGTRSSAQMNYTRTTFTGAYTPIATGTGATLSTAAGSGAVQTAVPIGFSFTYNGTAYTTLTICTEGWASFTATGTSATNTNLFGTGTPNATLAPYWDDLSTAAVGTNPAGSILYQTQGTPGSQTFTVQWTDVSSFGSTTSGQPAIINFQLVLFETTNVIEFHYGSLVGTSVNTSEAASIGIESQAGGSGNYIDALTGSSFVSNSMMNTRKWPNLRNYRFTPGAPTALAGGTYTVGVGQTYNNISDAAADLNHRGISGSVTLTLSDAMYDSSAANGSNLFPLIFGPVAGSSVTSTITIQPASGTATIRSRGVVTGSVGSSTTTAFGNTEEPIIAFIGTDFASVSNLDLQTIGAGVVDRGLLVANASPTDGAQNNTFSNFSISMNRAITGSRAVLQDGAAVAPTSAGGSNGGNKYYNISVSNVYAGIHLNGNASFRDIACEVGVTGAGTTVIGANIPDDIGNGTSATFGIKATNQQDVKIFGCEVRNLATTTTTDVDGIFVENGYGVCEVHRNKVHHLYNYSTTSVTAEVVGLRMNTPTAAGGYELRVYNNFVYQLHSSFAGTASATRQVKGIFAQSNGSGGTNLLSIDFNSVSIDNSTAPSASNACFEIGTSTGAIMQVRNNIFANFTGAQSGLARHYAWSSTTAGSIGNTGSTSDYNDLYIDNTTNGHTGRGGSTDYATLANWQAAVSADASSIAGNPNFIDPNANLHVLGVTVNGLANMTGITWVSSDIDNQARMAPHDIGADDYTPAALDVAFTNLISPATTGCYSASQNVTAEIQNAAAAALDFTVNPVTVVVNVTGTVTQSFTVTINNNTLNGGVPLPPTATLNVPMGTLNMSAAGTYTFNGTTTLTGDGTASNNILPTVNVNVTAGAASALSTSICAGNSTTLTLSGHNGTIQWQSYDAVNMIWVNESGTGNTSASYTVTPADTTMYRALVCGSLISDTVTIQASVVNAPTVPNVSRCGNGMVTMTATGTGTQQWYTTPTGGTPVFTGSTYSPSLSNTTTYYVESTLGSGTQVAGLPASIENSGYSASVEGLKFNVTTPITLQTVNVYPQNNGNITIQLHDAGGTLLNQAIVSVTGGFTVNTVPLNFAIAPGNDYELTVSTYGAGQLYRENPFTSWGSLPNAGGSVFITGGANINAYYYFYNWQISTGCTSPRTMVTATINPQPAVDLGNDTTICFSNPPFSLDAGNPGSTYSWNTSSTTQVEYVGTSGIYGVTVTAPGGCTDTDSINVTVNTPPLVFLGADFTQCGSTVLDAGNPGSNFAWTNGSTTQTTTVTTSGSYGVTVTDVNGCSSADTVTVTINPSPASNLSATLALCSGDSAVLDAGNTGLNFSWSEGSTTQTITVNAAGTYSVNVTDPLTGCSAADSTVVSLNALPTVNLGADITQCGGTALLDAGNAGSTFSWNTSATSQTISVSASGAYNVMVTDVNGCSGSDTIDVIINAIPVVNLGPNITQCGGSVLLNAGNPGGTYAWTGGATTQTITASTSGTYSVLVTNPQNCSSSDSVVVTINPLPVANGGNDTTICAGSNVTLNAGPGFSSYEWLFGTFTSNAQFVTVNPGFTTQYFLSVTDANGCTSAAYDTITITVEQQPAAAFSSNTVNGFNYTFTNTTTTQLPFTSTWDFGDGSPTASTTNAAHTYTANGTYIVTLSITTACGTTTLMQQIVVSNVGIEEASLFSGVNVYPNPSDGVFNLLISGADMDKLRLTVFDLAGRVALDLSEPAKGEYRKVIDLSSLSKGVYFLRLESGDETITRKLILQ